MSRAETGRAAEMRHSPSSWKDIVAKILGRIADPPAPKAQTPSAEARRPSGQRRWHTTSYCVPAVEECVAMLSLGWAITGRNEGTLELVGGGEVPGEKKEHEYGIKLVARAKKLAEYEVARISDLELIKKLEAQCSKLRSQRTQVEEQLCDMMTRLTEAEGKNWLLSKQTHDALTTRVNQCLRGYVLWQVETHKWLRLRELEHSAAEL
ncbi:hypothetical protein AXG93_3459s1050 [Marchantia polymorpha subsp. ruderalis]|uniref:Uncharacterized protein n=1 Tax=Marchantia polymorpha subsp. ruderalis TaxID=1480154 RepID=A0A176W5R6_MARPO|nr:hypothetical protein AXG93_3459s1050 [Marchantia polymorpha subsp. ruderalis]